MATASAHLIPSDEKADCFRLLSLIIDGGTTVLRYRFDQCIPPNNLQNKLNDTTIRGKLNYLRRKNVLTQEQWDLLYPGFGQPNSAHFDVSLLTCLLRHICGLDEQSPMWTCIPPSFDISIEADITRLRQYRNEVSHMISTHLTTQDFQRRWTTLEQVILRLGNGIPNLCLELETLKEGTIDPSKEKKFKEKIKEWEDMDRALVEEMDKLKQRIGEIDHELDQIKDSADVESQRATELDKKINHQEKTLSSVMKEQLDTHRNISSIETETAEHENKISNLEKRHSRLETSIENDRKQNAIKYEDIDDRLDRNEMKTSKIESVVLEIKSEMAEERFDRCSEMSSELKSLASMTELYLDDVRDQVYVTTYAYEKAKEILAESGCLILSGLPGEGKTTTAAKIISETTKPRRCLKLREPSDWKHIDLSKDLFDTFFIDDIFGAGSLDEKLLGGWATYLPDIEQAIRRRKVAFIITTRHYILEEAKDKMHRLNLFKDENVQLLASSELTQSERTEMLEAHLKHAAKQFDSKFLQDCNISYNTSFRNLHYQFPDHISETGELSEYLRGGKWTKIKAMVGFPEIVHMFANHDQLYRQGASFFEKPLIFFKKCMEDLFLDEEKFLALILLWSRTNQELQLTDLERVEISKEIEMITTRFGYKMKSRLLKTLKKSLNYHKDGFLKFEKQTGTYSFCHNIVKDMVGLVAGKEYLDTVLEFANEDFLMQYVTTDEEKDDSFHLYIGQFRFEKLHAVMVKYLVRKPKTDLKRLQSMAPIRLIKIFSITRVNHRDIPMQLGDDTVNTAVLKHDCFRHATFVNMFLESEEGIRLLSRPVLTLSGQFGYYGIDFGEKKLPVYLPSRALLYGNSLLLEQCFKKELTSAWADSDKFLYVSLLFAVHQGMQNAAELLLKRGATVTEDAIFVAAEKQHTETLNFLLKRRGKNYAADSNIINKNSPLIAAVKRGNSLSVHALIENGADINYRNSKNTSALEKAVLYKKPIVCKILLENGATVNYKTGKFKRTPLHMAADVGDKAITELLLQHGASVNARDYRGHYPIQCAAIRGNRNTVDALLKWDISQASFRLRSYGKKSLCKGMNLVHVAVWKNDPGLLDVLIKHNVNVNARDFYGRTPFYCAVFYGSLDEYDGNSEILERLINVADVQQPEKNGYTPLQTAIHRGNTDIAKKICSLPNINANAKDRFGKTALHTACEMYNLEIFRTLVEDCSADVYMITEKGKTIWHILVEYCLSFDVAKSIPREMSLYSLYEILSTHCPGLEEFKNVVTKRYPALAINWAEFSERFSMVINKNTDRS